MLHKLAIRASSSSMLIFVFRFCFRFRFCVRACVHHYDADASVRCFTRSAAIASRSRRSLPGSRYDFNARVDLHVLCCMFVSRSFVSFLAHGCFSFVDMMLCFVVQRSCAALCALCRHFELYDRIVKNLRYGASSGKRVHRRNSRAKQKIYIFHNRCILRSWRVGRLD